MSKLIDGKKFADKLCNKIAEEVGKLKDKNINTGSCGYTCWRGSCKYSLHKYES